MGNIFLTAVLLMFGTLQAADKSTDPIKCWWKTDKNAVEVGEQFTLTLTCGLMESHDTTAVVKPEQLDPGALHLEPFEVVSGVRHDDIQSPPWRYFQYEYTMRLIGQDYFGQDVEIPELTVIYNVQSGRDQMYVLPAINMRIMSLVPKKANDIRESTADSFAAAKARSSRATTEFIAAWVLFAFALLMLAFAVVHAIRRKRELTPNQMPAVSGFKLVRSCLHELGRLQSEVAVSGWTPERAGAALTVLRIGSAVAMGRGVAQSPMNGSSSVREGQIAVQKRILSRERIVVSAPITHDAVERYGINGDVNVADLGKALAAFTAVRYGQNGKMDPAGLNHALARSRAALERLRIAAFWALPKRWMWTR